MGKLRLGYILKLDKLKDYFIMLYDEWIKFY